VHDRAPLRTLIEREQQHLDASTDLGRSGLRKRTTTTRSRRLIAP
jgi:hypothetical protein